MKKIMFCFFSVLSLFLFYTHIIYASNPFFPLPTTVAVMDLEAGEGISKGTAMTLSDYLRTQLVNTNLYAIVTRENMEQILKEQQFQLSNCTSQECIVQVGKLLGARKMFAGSIGKVGTTYLITLRIIDVESGKIEKAETEKCTKCEEDSLIKSIKNIVDKIKIIEPDWANIKEEQPVDPFLEIHNKEKAKFEAEVDSYTKAIEKNPKNVAEYYMRRAQSYSLLKRYQDAISDCSKGIELNPKNKEILAACHYLRGLAYSYTGDDDKSMNDFSKAIELNPTHYYAYTARGEAYEKNGDYDNALKDYSKAIELAPKSYESYIARGFVYDNLGKSQDAINDYAKAKRIAPYWPVAAEIYGRGLDYQTSGQYQKAINMFTRAVELDPKFTNAYYARGDAYGNLGDYQKAIDDYTKAIELNPEFAGVYSARGMAYDKSGDYQKAIDDHTKAIKLYPNVYDYYARGFDYYRLGQYPKAINDFNKAIELGPEFAEAYTARGMAYLSQGILLFSVCDDYYQAGLLYLKQGKRTQAVNCVDVIKGADPSSPLIKKLMDKIYEEQ